MRMTLDFSTAFRSNSRAKCMAFVVPTSINKPIRECSRSCRHSHLLEVLGGLHLAFVFGILP